MMFNLRFQKALAILIFASGIVFLPPLSIAKRSFVTLPKIHNNTVAPRMIYIKNPRFPPVMPNELRKVALVASGLVKEHFGIKVEMPTRIPIRDIDDVFAKLVVNEPASFRKVIGDFRSGNVDWRTVREQLIKQIKKQKDPLSKQIKFARPYLSKPLIKEDIASFSQVETETFKERLSHWTAAKLADGHPIIGTVLAGRPELPLNEYAYWALMAKRGIQAEIILTNQLVASVEYFSIPVHTSIRGGVTGGSTEFNPSSKFESSVWISLFPYLSDNRQIIKFRNGDTYSRDNALSYAGAMLAHEIGHQLLQLGHPWSNTACPMRPA